MLVGIAGAKDAPGVTTLAWGLALAGARSPQSRTLLVEADPDGGCLAARLRLSQERGLASLAATARHQLSMSALLREAQSGPGGVALLVAPSAPHHARAALESLGPQLGEVLAELSCLPVPVVCDLGRLHAGSTALSVAGAIGKVVFVARPSLEGTDALGVRLAELADVRDRAALVTAGDGPYRSQEIAETLSLPLAGHLPADAPGATRLWNGTSHRRPSPLERAISAIAATLSTGANLHAQPEVTFPIAQENDPDRTAEVVS